MTDSQVQPQRTQPNRILKPRHIHFIALGSAIGTGLFYGSAGAIQAAGPAVLLVYLLGGLIVYLMLRALGEMAVAHPVSGSFAEYCRGYLGSWAGFITGWMYAFEMIIVCLADLTAITLYMHLWFPSTPGWVWVTAVLLIVGGINLASAKAFGEMEFWLTLLKITAVLAMIVGGIIILVFGIQTDTHTGVDNLWIYGFAPNGIGGAVSALVLVLFAFGGTEIIGVTAGEAEDPEKTIPKAINTVPARILIFYVATIFIILCVIPWTQITGDESPFVQIFTILGVNWAATLLNIVVISAALSAINSDLYGAGRVLYGMAERKLAPASFAKLDKKGIPQTTVLCLLGALVIGIFLQLINQTAADIFTHVAALATFATIFVWLMILLAQLASRKSMTPVQKAQLKFPVPLGTPGQVFAIVMILFTFGTMAWQPQFRPALLAGVLFTAVMTGVYFTRIKTNLPRKIETVEQEKE